MALPIPLQLAVVIISLGLMAAPIIHTSRQIRSRRLVVLAASVTPETLHVHLRSTTMFAQINTLLRGETARSAAGSGAGTERVLFTWRSSSSGPVVLARPWAPARGAAIPLHRLSSIVILLTTLGNGLLNGMLAPLLGPQHWTAPVVANRLDDFTIAAAILVRSVVGAVSRLEHAPGVGFHRHGSAAYSFMQPRGGWDHRLRRVVANVRPDIHTADWRQTWRWALRVHVPRPGKPVAARI